jgi:glycosyltransferase involved in cell wall biosynthesis
MSCIHRGSVISRRLGGDSGDVCIYSCSKFGRCVESPAMLEQMPGAQVHICNGPAADNPRLSIVMPMFRRSDSVRMTILALKMMHRECWDDIEIIVCDNEPEESAHGREVRKLLTENAGPIRSQFVAFREYQGTAVGKQKAIEAATGDAILCIDSHVIIPPGAIRRLIDWYNTHPTTMDLYQGPCIRDDLVGSDGSTVFAGTHFEPRWSGRMYGVWGNDPRALGEEPYEIGANGMGLFSCRREAWPNFDAESRGFGVEEFTLHAKVTKRGDKTILLPWLHWWHLFGHVDTAATSGTTLDIIESYIRSAIRTGVPDLGSVRDHFVNEMKDLTIVEFKQLTARVAARPLSTTQRIATIAGVFANTAAKGGRLAEQSVIDQRMETCKTCPQFDGKSCNLCGCSTTREKVYLNKLAHESSECPIKKWGPVLPGLTPAITASSATASPAIRAITKPAPTLADPPNAPSVAVIITSHAYGRFLKECVESVLSQDTLPAEVLIVDDDSIDETAEVAASFAAMGVRYLWVENRHVYLTRKDGLAATASPLIVFLDADDTLGPTYLTECIEEMSADPTIGIVTSDLTMFGTRDGLLSHQPKNLEGSNWIHAGSMVRRVALSQSGAYDHHYGPSMNAHEDWFVWRHVARNGWKTVKIKSPAYFYRQHPDSMMHGMTRAGEYYTRSSLDLERITLVLPVCRDRYFNRIADWVKGETCITDIMIIDSSDDKQFRSRLQQWAINLGLQSVTYISRPPSKGLADADRAGSVAVYRGVQAAMPQIYSNLERVVTEYNIILEDDVIPPHGACERLLRDMDVNVAGVSGVVPSRYQPGHAIAGYDFTSTIPYSDRKDTQDVAYTGFAFACIRKSMLIGSWPLHNGGQTGDYDIEFCRAIRAKGLRWLIDWSVRCGHAEMPRPSESRVEIDWITAQLAVGNALTCRDDATELLKAGVTHIINCREISDTTFVDGTGLIVLNNGTPDTKPPHDQPAEWFYRSLDFAEAVLQDPKTRLFVHCQGGVSRGPSTAYAILRETGYTPEQAEKLVRDARPVVQLEYMRTAEVALASRGTVSSLATNK